MKVNKVAKELRIWMICLSKGRYGTDAFVGAAKILAKLIGGATTGAVACGCIQNWEDKLQVATFSN